MLREKPEFYKEEVRCGYTVNEKTKRVWAVQLEMLDEVERICKANGLKYFADSGTLIGAIRHEGYIPCEDDFMKQEYGFSSIKRGASSDFEKFCAVKGR